MVCVVSFWVLRASFFLFAFLWCLVEFLRLKDRRKPLYALWYKRARDLFNRRKSHPQPTACTPPSRPSSAWPCSSSRTTSLGQHQAHRLSSPTTPLHMDSRNLKTSEPKASETLCARITALPESRPQPRLRPSPRALRALACAITVHVPSCARARAGRVLVLVPSCARARAGRVLQ